jgi:hypothetical protein
MIASLPQLTEIKSPTVGESNNTQIGVTKQRCAKK